MDDGGRYDRSDHRDSRHRCGQQLIAVDGSVDVRAGRLRHVGWSCVASHVTFVGEHPSTEFQKYQSSHLAGSLDMARSLVT